MKLKEATDRDVREITHNTLMFLETKNISYAQNALDKLLKLKTTYRVNFTVKRTNQSVLLSLAYFIKNNQGYNTTIPNLFLSIKQHQNLLIADRQKCDGEKN